MHAAFSPAYLFRAMESGLIKMSLPDKPNSGKQRYPLTALGQAIWRGLPVPVRAEALFQELRRGFSVRNYFRSHREGCYNKIKKTHIRTESTLMDVCENIDRKLCGTRDSEAWAGIGARTGARLQGGSPWS
ncbi:MAG: Fic family protein [Leptospirillia bacterium]